MAFRRSLCNRVTIMARRYQPSFAYVLHEEEHMYVFFYLDFHTPCNEATPGGNVEVVGKQGCEFPVGG
ncbi:hypothetical protein E1A91_D11G026400v1 [Gossypium mustelinum]|uniref:Uncharacterized protein n=1 Tax=Gossypium mustelinum TaxID=34275 RepID=A0A5D2SMG9_GOSMU|nr:hypothetical protein E1A91_D11G026400v1 [Gossypium mustelinum]